MLARTGFKNKPRKPLARGVFKRKATLAPKKRSKTILEASKRKPRGEKTTAKLKKDLDHYFSQFIRLKHSDANGNVACYTCGKIKHWKEQQNGHFISRQYLVTRWNEDNCRVQCAGCNIFGNGQLLDFEEHLKHDLGEEFIELMKKSRHAILKLDRQWYEQEITFYKKRVEELMK